MKTKFLILHLALIIGCTMACNKSEKKSLQELEEEELAKGIRKDELFLDMYLGMSQKDFFDKCWNLNKQGILREGHGNMTAAYQLNKGEMKFEAQMDFYPRFVNEKIAEMPMYFSYKTWAPWNEETQSVHLIKDVHLLMEKWYGGGFFISPLPTGGKGFVKVEGNRRIMIELDGDKDVKVTISDLTVKEVRKNI